MKHGPGKILTTLGASAIALCASVALATPALANDISIGDLQFSSTDTIYRLPDETMPADGTGLSADADQVTITGGDADITVTTVESESEADVNEITIGSVETPYAGTVTFDNIKTDHLDVNIEGDGEGLAVYFDTCNISNAMINVEGTGAGLMVVINDSMITGCSDGEALINVAVESTADLSISGSDLAGAAGGSGNFTTNGGPAIAAANEGTITFSGDSTVIGGKGASSTDAPGAGGPGIYAPGSTLEMSDGSLVVQVGVDGGEVAMADRNVGLTVGTLDLSNGTGVNGQGPSITAIGWPQENSVPLNLSGIDAGSRDESTFYPWLLQVSTNKTNPGSNPQVARFAGDGYDNDMEREGWTWFNIAPHEIQGLAATVETNTDYDEGVVYNCLNPVEGTPELSYLPMVMPVFGLEGVEDWEWISGATIPDAELNTDEVTWREVTYEDEGTERWFTLNPSFDDNSLTISGTAELPDYFAALYPGLSANIETELPVTAVKAVYRLYNNWENTHLYTTDTVEVKDDVAAGWTNEGASWFSPAVAAGADTVIQRLYNPFNGDHYYVQSTDEKQIAELTGLGWVPESSESDILSLPASQGKPVYTLFNPYNKVDTHLYTPDANEVSVLTGLGWEENTTIIYCYPIVNLTALPTTSA